MGWPRKLITIYTTVSIVKNIPQFTRRRATPQMRVLHLQPCHLLGKKGERNGGKNARNSFYFCFTRHGCWALAYNEKLSPWFEEYNNYCILFPHHNQEYFQAMSQKSEKWDSQNSSYSLEYLFQPIYSNDSCAINLSHEYL